METQDELQAYPSSVLEKGYGVVGKLVMQDRRLNAISKAIYAYICTFGTVAFPGRDKICYDLQISKNTYAKYMHELVLLGYISVEQKRGANNAFQRNIYTVNIDPSKVKPREDKPEAAKHNKSKQGKVDREKLEPEGKETAEEDVMNPHLKEVLDRVKARHRLKDAQGKDDTPPVPEATPSPVSQNLVHGEKSRVPNGGTPPIGTHNITTTAKEQTVVVNKTATTEQEVLPREYRKLNNTPTKSAVAVDIFELASLLGVEEASLRGFIAKYGEKRTEEKLQLLKEAVHRQNIGNPSGWLCRALQLDFLPVHKAETTDFARIEQAIRDTNSEERAIARRKNQKPVDLINQGTEELREKLLKVCREIDAQTRRVECSKPADRDYESARLHMLKNRKIAIAYTLRMRGELGGDEDDDPHESRASPRGGRAS